MAFDTTVTFDIAKRLFIREGSEAGYRSTTNRAYYSAYHVCSKAAKSRNYSPGKKHQNFEHTELSDNLVKHNASNKNKTKEDININKLGRMLRQSKDLRTKADYRDGIYSRNQAQDSLQLTDAINTLAKKL